MQHQKATFIKPLFWMNQQKLNETQRPWVPQPGTARSFEAQDQLRELLEEQRSENR